MYTSTEPFQSTRWNAQVLYFSGVLQETPPALSIISKLIQWRRQRQRERQKSSRIRLAKQQLFTYFLEHFFAVTTRLYDVKLPNFMFCGCLRFVEDANTRQRLYFSFPFSFFFSSRKICRHLPSWPRWTERDWLWRSANSLFKCSFRSRSRLRGLSTLTFFSMYSEASGRFARRPFRFAGWKFPGLEFIRPMY